MNNEELTQKVLSLQEEITTLAKREKQLEDEARDGFSRIMNIMESLVKSEVTRKEIAEASGIDEFGDRLSEVEDNLETFQEEITNKLAWETDISIEEMEKVLESIIGLIKYDRDAINAILKHIKKKDNVTVWDVLSTLTTLRGLLGIP